MKKLTIIIIIAIILIIGFSIYLRNELILLSFFKGKVTIQRQANSIDEQRLIAKAELLNCSQQIGCVDGNLLDQYRKEADKINKTQKGYADLRYTTRVIKTWPGPIQAENNKISIYPDYFYNIQGEKITKEECQSELGENYSIVEFFME